MNAKKKLSSLSLMNIVIDENKSWFMNERWNAVFQMNRKTFEISFVDFPKLFWGAGNDYKWLAKWKQRFAYIPNRSDIPLYLADAGREHSALMLPGQEKKHNYIICGILQKEKFLYLFTDSKDFSVIEFNLESNELTRHLKWDDCVLDGKCLPLQWGNVVYCGGSIWSPVVGTNCIVEIKFETFKYVIHQKEEDIQYKWPFVENEGMYWALVSQAKKDYCIVTGGLLRDSNDKIIDLSSYVKGRVIKDLRICENLVWLFPGDDGNIIKIDFLNGTYKELSYPNGFRWIQDRRYESGIRFTCIEDAKNKWILYPRTGNGILSVDKDTDIIDYIPLEVDMIEIMKWQAQKVVMENVSSMEDGLYFLLELMNRENECASREVLNEKNANGYKIFHELMNSASVN